jgi:hypothetical protein
MAGMPVPDLDASRHRKWTAADAALIGTMKDAQLARLLGRTRNEVVKERVRRRILAYRKPRSPESLLHPSKREKLRRERISQTMKSIRRQGPGDGG